MTRCRDIVSVGVRAIAAALLIVGGLSCKREERGFRVNPPSVRPASAIRVTDLVPGTQPTSQPVAPEIGATRNDYEQNAYAMSEGQRFYTQYNCSGCHANGGGGMGPPLMDEHWLYGNRPEQVYASIVQGRPNGMPAWAGRLPDDQVWKLVAFVRSMSGLTPQDAAPARQDHMKSAPPPNTIDYQPPTGASVPKSAEVPQ